MGPSPLFSSPPFFSIPRSFCPGVPFSFRVGRFPHFRRCRALYWLGVTFKTFPLFFSRLLEPLRIPANPVWVLNLFKLTGSASPVTRSYPLFLPQISFLFKRLRYLFFLQVVFSFLLWTPLPLWADKGLFIPPDGLSIAFLPKCFRTMVAGPTNPVTWNPSR